MSRISRLCLTMLVLVPAAGPLATEVADEPPEDDFAEEYAAETAARRDPLEPFNRRMQKLNDRADSFILRPVAKQYQRLPQFPRRRVTHFFSNLNDVNVMVNDLLQGKPRAALSDFGRIAINTTIGLGGLFDPASRMGLRKNEEDWGQTLAVWGIGQGPYMVLPLIGPTTLRDALTAPVDRLFNPVAHLDDTGARAGARALDTVAFRASVLPADSLVVGDRYLFFQSAYLQRRDYQIADGELEDPFDEEF